MRKNRLTNARERKVELKRTCVSSSIAFSMGLGLNQGVKPGAAAGGVREKRGFLAQGFQY